MPGDELRRVMPGDGLRIPARTYNRMLDAIDVIERLDQFLRDPKTGIRDPSRVLVRNKSGAARDRWDVLGIDVPIVTPTQNATEFQNRPAVDGVVPQAEHVGQFVILEQPLPVDAIGTGILSGIVPVRLLPADFGTSEFADVDAGNADALKVGEGSAAHILWEEDSESEHWGLVRIGNPGGTGGGGGGGDTSSCDCLSDFNGVQTTTQCSGAVDAWEWDASVVMDELGCTLTTSGDKTAVNWDPATPDIYNSRDFVDCGYDSAKWELDLSVGLMPGQVELRLVHDDPDVDVRYRNAYYWRCDGRNWMVPTVNKLPGDNSPTLCAVCLEPVVCNTVCEDGINLRHVDEWEVTIAGVTGGTCPDECDGINGTWRLKFGSEPVECKSWVWGTTGDDPSMSLTIATDVNGDTVYALRITTYLTNGPCDTSNHVYELSVSQPAEQCIQSRELADQDNVSGESCSNWPATLTITPTT